MSPNKAVFRIRNSSIFAGCFCLAVLFTGFAAYALDPAAVLSSFQLQPDLQIVLVAREPQVFSPVDMEFDEHGNLFVMEMPGYPFPDPNNPGKIVELSDKDGDGVYETRSVFATGFTVGVSILPYEGGLLVASPPDLLFVKDTDGDGKADVREILLSGFEVENPQHNFNGLTYGLDNWIYGVSGGNAGEVYWPNEPIKKVSIRNQDFRIDFHKKIFERIGRSSGGFGLATDDWGHLFETHNTDHINNLVFPGRYLEGIPTGRHGSLEMISDHEEGGLARIYAIGEQQTRVNHPEQSGYFSGACGVAHYGGGAFPTAFNDNVFVCDVVLNLIHQDVISPVGAGFKASRGIQKAEFLASTDRAFRPVNLAVGPDGALYVVDMHRDIIEHPEWIPKELQTGMDFNAGKDKGRIFRITPKSGLPRVTPVFDPKKINDVVASLGSPNQWTRTTAQRLLVQWQDKASIAPLKELLAKSDDPHARLHTMWTLNGLGALSDAEVIKEVADAHPGVRENALLVAESRLSNAKVLNAVMKRGSDSDARVRMYCALVLSRLDDASAKRDAKDIHKALFQIADADVGNQWSRLALLAAMNRQATPMLLALSQNQELLAKTGAREQLNALANLVGRHADAKQVSGAVSSLVAMPKLDRAVLASVLDGMAEGVEVAQHPIDPKTLGDTAERLNGLLGSDSTELQRASLRLCRALGVVQSDKQAALLEAAAKRAKDESLPAAERLSALNLLAFAEFGKRADILFSLLDTHQPKELQLAAVQQLQRENDPSIGPRLIETWPGLGPEVRMQASNILLYRQQNHDALLTALESGRLPLGQFNFDLERRRRLLWDSNENTKKRAEKLFSDAGVVTRKAALDKMAPALKLKGDATRGHGVYQENCMKCHIVGKEGIDLGPNLTEISRKSAETLFHDILDPNAAVDAKYISFSVETKGDALGGETITGLLVNEDDESVTIREAGGNDRTFKKKDVATLKSTGLSTMPEGLEESMTPQKLADLLAFLQQQK